MIAVTPTNTDSFCVTIIPLGCNPFRTASILTIEKPWAIGPSSHFLDPAWLHSCRHDHECEYIYSWNSFLNCAFLICVKVLVCEKLYWVNFMWVNVRYLGCGQVLIEFCFIECDENLCIYVLTTTVNII
jgi:hypothetical protein